MTTTRTRTVALRPQWHPDDDIIDGVTIECCERWKDSELSGSEWRFSYTTKLWRKGKVIAIDGGHYKLENAVAHLPWLLKIWGESGRYLEDIPKSERWSGLSIRDCCQPGCAEPATLVRRMRRTWSKPCDLSAPATDGEVRSFCERHRHRGDSGLDDGESNYGEPEALPVP